MKVKKEDLTALTQNAISTSILAVTGLVVGRCPIPELYRVVEDHMHEIDNLRTELGLERLTPPELAPGFLSGKVKKALARAEQRKAEKQGKIGFQAPGSEGEVKEETKEAASDDGEDTGISVDDLNLGDKFQMGFRVDKSKKDWN